MLSYLIEDLYKDVIPLLEKVPVKERAKAEKLVSEIKVKIEKSGNAFDVNTWYGNNSAIRDEVARFEEHSDVHVADFGAKVKWLLTKAPYFYSDD